MNVSLGVRVGVCLFLFALKCVRMCVWAFILVWNHSILVSLSCLVFSFVFGCGSNCVIYFTCVMGGHVYVHRIWQAWLWHDASEDGKACVHICDTTHSYVWHDPFKCVTWLIYMCDVTYVWHDSLTYVWLTYICVTWLIHMCDVVNNLMGYVTNQRNGSCHAFANVNESCHTYEWVMSHTWMSHATHVKESCHTYEWIVYDQDTL